MLKDVQIDVTAYYAINERNQLRQFIADPMGFLTTQRISAINSKVNKLKRRH